METDYNSAETRTRVDRLIRDFLGERSDFSFEKYIKSQGLQDLNTLNQAQKRQFAENLIDRVIRPATSGGKTSMARVELMSILRIGVEPWKITSNYVPSPKEYLLSAEMTDEFRKLKHGTIYREVMKYGLKDRKEVEPEVREKVVNTIIGELFGAMTKTTLTYTQKLYNKRPIEWVINNSLQAYIKPDEARESARGLMQLINVLVKSNEQDTHKDINPKELSEKLRDDFTDTNQVVLRRLKNELNIGDLKTVADSKKQRILHTMMSHYFGQMSDRYLSLEVDKMSLKEEADEAAADRMRLINAIIYDCLHTTMSAADAKAAHLDLKDLINP